MSALLSGGDAGSLARFRALAWTVGTLLLLLTVGVVLRYGFGVPGLSRAVSPVHGLMYVVYLLAVLDLGRRLGWRAGRLLTLALAGVVPGLSFVVERGVTVEARRALAL